MNIAGFLALGDGLSVALATTMTGDATMNNRLFLSNDASFGGTLYVVKDVSFNNRLSVLGDVSFNQRLNVRNDVSFNSRLSVGGDLSLNQRLYVTGSAVLLSDVSINRLFISNAILPTSTLIINNNPASNQSRLFINLIGGNNSSTGNSNGNFNLFFDNFRDNLTFGDNAGSNIIVSSYNNTTLQNYLSVSRNIALSKNSLNALGGVNTSSASDNVAIGYFSMTSLPLGHSNTAVGSYTMPALGSTQTYPIPVYTNDSITSNNNTLFGFNTMNTPNIQTPSSYNTAIGSGAFSSISTGGSYNYNTFIGYNAAPVSGVFNNQIVLGTTSETTYIPGLLSPSTLNVTGTSTFNNNVIMNQTLTVNGSLIATFANNSIQSGAISGLVDYVKSAMAVASSSSSVSSITSDISAFDAEYNFATVWSQIANTSSSTRFWTSVAMSLTGEYQTAVDYGPSFNDNVTGGYIYTSNDFGSTWKQRAVKKTWIAVAMSTSGQYQSASYATGVSNGYIYISSSYGVYWYISPGSPNLTINSLTIASQGDIQYASVNGGFFLASSTYGNNWYQSTTNGTGSGLWQTISTNSSGQFVCFAGNSTYIYTSVDKGVTINKASNVTGNWNSSSVSYSGQYMIVCAGAYASSSNIVKLGSTGTASLPGNLYMSSNFGTSFYLVNPTITTQWTSVAMSGTGQYIIATTQDSVTQGNPGPIYTSLNYGLTWAINPNSPQQNWFSCAISSTGQYITAVSPQDTIYTSITPYYSLAVSGLLTTNNLTVNGITNLAGPTNPITMLDGSSLATAEFPLDFVSGFGANWTLPITTSMTSVNATNIAMSSSGQYQTTISGNNLYYSCNYGNNWTTVVVTPGGAFIDICLSGNGQYQYANSSSYPSAGYGNICISNNFGVTWSITNSIQTKTWTSISCSQSGQYIVGTAYNDYIYLSSDYGISWASIITLSKPWIHVCLSASGQYIYAVSLYNSSTEGYIYISNNYGISFTQITSVSKYWQRIATSGSGQYVGAIASSQTNVTPDYIFISSNYGNSFSQVGASLYWQNISISGSGKYMLAVTQGSTANSVGYVYKSIDFGKTWSQISSNNQAYNGVCVSSTGQYLASCSSSGILISTTPYPTFSVSNNLYVGSTNQFKVDAAGNITTSGTITSAGGFTASEMASLRIGGASLGTNALAVTGTASFSGQVSASSFNATSDYRIKDNVEPLTASTSVDTLKPIKFFNTKSKKSDIGFLAHEVQETFPFLVNGEKDGAELQTLNYIGIIGILVKEVQELKRELKEIKEKL
jgi:hypothetical protein